MSSIEASKRTLAHYNQSADQFWVGTKDHDVSQNYAALLDAIDDNGIEPPFSILDVGCGPGRDLIYFRAQGHQIVGLDGSRAFVDHARDLTGCEVWHQDFIKLDLPAKYFDGVFANASLFHVPTKELPRVLGEFHTSLKPGGILFASNPRGNNQEGMQGERYCCFHDYETWLKFLSDAEFTELSHYYRPTGLPREQQPWLASVWQKS